MTVVQRAVWYIESHSGEDLSLADVAGATGVSAFHLARLFRAATGWPVARYIRVRRLSEAARQLSEGASDILSLALSSGYGSHEAFTRAFRETFGVPPEDVRQRRHLNGLPLLLPLRVVQESSAPSPALRVETIGPLRLAGIEASYLASDTAGIPSQWQRLHGEGSLDSHRYTYGVCSATDSEGRFTYLAAYGIAHARQARAGHRHLHLAPQRYLVVRHEGHVGSIPRTWHALLDRWLPAAGFTAVEAPDFERYDAAFDPRTGYGGVDICVPIH
ncbi:AraC family transcriptional regulator [Luteibacter sahnii]|jgi:AraC family transcriptional regulator|uniref:AraC family transcriptional regulator n=1 Tax=Luteibacter sahnii TaxID=3021977 RepID=UPI002A6A8AA2|nr:AraC family transcriptional regulator [Luteibacter sp. PPL193]MDY1547634.1 AraC family transcriptional regulator [Luteibacter sp. PPL193]